MSLILIGVGEREAGDNLMRVKNESIQKGQKVFNNKSLKMPTVYIYIIMADNIVL